MSNKKIISILLVLCITLSALLVGCGEAGGESDAEKITYTIQLSTQGGMPLEDVMVKVYKDGEMKNLQWASATDREGKVSFDAEPSKTYYAVLEKVPNGYKIETNYEITGENTTISLETVLGDGTDLSATNFKLGSVVTDFSVTATDGKEYKISELLKTKKAIVLNFWFLNCGPCKIEFPYLQQAYVDYQDRIEVLAINSVDGTKEIINDFAKDTQLTFPMVKYDGSLQFDAFPTTVVIDRYGTICMLHKGMITSKEEFTKIFEFFTADDYKQSLIRNLSDIE